MSLQTALTLTVITKDLSLTNTGNSHLIVPDSQFTSHSLPPPFLPLIYPLYLQKSFSTLTSLSSFFHHFSPSLDAPLQIKSIQKHRHRSSFSFDVYWHEKGTQKIIHMWIGRIMLKWKTTKKKIAVWRKINTKNVIIILKKWKKS